MGGIARRSSRPARNALGAIRPSAVRARTRNAAENATQVGIAAVTERPRRSTRSVTQAWQRIERWLDEYAVPFRGALSSGASAQGLARAERQMGRRLPPQLAESLLVHDGEGFFAPTGLIGEWNLLSADGVARASCQMASKVADDVFGDRRGDAHPAIRDVWWHTGWIPFVSSGSGHYMCIDTEPTERGQRGQVFLWLHDSGQRYLMAHSLADWLHAVADDMEAGTYRYDSENGFNHHAFMKSSLEGRELYDRRPRTGFFHG